MPDRRAARRGELHETAASSAPGARMDLERERVAEIQRERMLGAMVELARERGSERVTVAHVVTRAGVSRRTFYELFSDREACFLAALEHALARVAAVVLPAYRGERDWCDRIRAGLTAMLELFDEEPATAALCVVDALGAGPRALRRRAEVLERLVDAVDRGRREAPAGAEPHAGRAVASRIVAEGVVGAVLAVLHGRLLASSPKPLMGLRGQLMSMIVLPYRGPDAAAAELSRRAPRVRRVKRAREDPLRGLNMRLTYRTMRVLAAIAAGKGLSNREVARAAEVVDQGQISKLLARLQGLGLISNAGEGAVKGEANTWVLTARGVELEQALRARAEH
jgi:AcrR family transcriptional regulator/DNA-binding MarR family transcriptional regulator